MRAAAGRTNVTVMTSFTHKSVLLDEAVSLLDVRPGGTYIDCTTGLGGHSAAIAERMGKDGQLLCLDQDAEALEFARTKLAPFGSGVKFVHGNFRELKNVAEDHGIHEVDGILMDLGVSSLQLDSAERGFSFGRQGPLDMRMNPTANGDTAADIVNSWDESSLAELLKSDGEVRHSRRIAHAIVAARPLVTTWDLAKAVGQVAGGARDRNQIHPATLVFLALRIHVNGELDSLTVGLTQARDLLGFGNTRGGRIAAISFHSLEDRIIKQFFRREAENCICPKELPVCRCDHRATLRVLTKRPLRATATETAGNPRARSALLRGAERIA